MKFKTIFISAFFTVAMIFTVSMASAKDHGKAVAGTYKGKVNIEILQQELDLTLELKRTHNDSIIVIIKDFAVSPGQKFNYTSDNLLVKPEVKNGKTVYNISSTFTYSYNNMPVSVKVTGTIQDKDLDSEVKGTIMGSMETKVKYKAKKV